MRFGLLSVASPLALVVAMAASGADAQTDTQTTSPSPVSSAQVQTDATEVGEVVVTGLRESLRNSERIKRDSSGVVDAITAEDIGKFPDTNLAESIQRIPGVTIDRENNEGARITVRGFGPEFNLVTLNGRSMPGGLGINDTSFGTRSFDFANISSDGVAGITVYKTGRADIPSGGIGSTVDILTARPFDFSGQRASFQIRGTDDTSNNKITPEVSGLYSNTFADGKIGLLLNGSYSERDNREEVATVGGYLRDQIPAGVDSPNVTYQGGTPTAHNWEPQSEGWGFNDYQRKRTNAQAVLQFRPVNNITATADYTYYLVNDAIDRHSFGAWFGYGGDLHSATFNQNGTVVDLRDTGSDLSYSTFNDHIRNEGKSAGFNLKWDPLDNLSVSFDAHHSTSDTGGGDGGNNTFFIVGQQPAFSNEKIFQLGKTDIPTTLFTYNAPYSLGSLDTSTIAPLFAQANTNYFRNRIDEERVDLTWKNNNADGGLQSIKAGAQYRDFGTRSRTFNSFYGTGYYNPADDGLVPASAFTKQSSCDILSQFSGGGCDILVPYYYTYEVGDAVAATKGKYNYDLVLPDTPTNDDKIDEKTIAGYVQAAFDTDFNGMRFRALVGVRYEHTDVTASSLQQQPTAVSWDNPTEFHTLFAADPTFSHETASYDEFLPSIDTSLEVRKNLIFRASYSKTITRPDLYSMRGTTSVSTTPKPGARTASAGNPGLQPYESQNFDLTAEWYYARDSYLAVNVFDKHVTNFLTTTTTQGPVDGLTDPLNGAIAKKAQAEVVAAGKDPTAANIFAQMQADTGQTSFTGQPGDPLIIWDITTPSNANAVDLHGVEITLQHVFGESGFGLQANVSLPAGGAHFNPSVVDLQFVLPGLSRSYNLVGFYEKHGFQARVAYTHRDKFLAALGQSQGAPGEPTFVAAYGQLDASASYQINQRMAIFVDGINLTKSKTSMYGRFEEQFLLASEGFARVQAGVRFKF